MDAIVFDLGLSSMQLDAAGAAFPFARDEPLDMRFDPQLGPADRGRPAQLAARGRARTDAARVRRGAARATPGAHDRAAPRAAAVRAHRRPGGGGHSPRSDRRAGASTRRRARFRRCASRSTTSLARSKPGWTRRCRLLRPGGRMAVISFQSLEDRIVKWRFRGWADAGPRARADAQAAACRTRDEMRRQPAGAQRQAARRGADARRRDRRPTSLSAKRRSRRLARRHRPGYARARRDNGVSPPPRTACSSRAERSVGAAGRARVAGRASAVPRPAVGHARGCRRSCWPAAWWR